MLRLGAGASVLGLGSAALGSSQAWASGNTFTLTTQGWSIAPLAA